MNKHLKNIAICTVIGIFASAGALAEDLSKQAKACLAKTKGGTWEIVECLSAEVARDELAAQKAYLQARAKLQDGSKEQKNFDAYYEHALEDRKFFCVDVLGDETYYGQMAAIQGNECMVRHTKLLLKDMQVFAD